MGVETAGLALGLSAGAVTSLELSTRGLRQRVADSFANITVQEARCWVQGSSRYGECAAPSESMLYLEATRIDIYMCISVGYTSGNL